MHIKSHKSVEQIARKHRMDVSDIQKQLDMGEPIEHEHTKDHKLAMDIALQHLDEIPDYYTRLKKMEASARKEHKKFKDMKEETKSGDQGLRDWFGKSKSSGGKKGWVQLGGKFSGEPCARQPGQTSTPKCGSSKMAANLSPEEEEKARIRKNRLDPNQPEKTGGSKPTNVRTEEMNLQEVKDKPGKDSGKKDACYTKVKSRYDVWPSAYASGALVKCRKVGAANWGTKSEDCWDGYVAKGMKKKGKKIVPNCVPVNSESTESLGYDWDTPIRERADRYCPRCEKLERRLECKYGPRYWDTFSLPAELINSKKEYNTIMPHFANEDYEYSMARSEISTIIGAAKRLKKKIGKGEGNIEAWVQSKITKAADYLDTAADYVDSGEMKKESVSIEDANGNHYAEFIDIIKPEPLRASKGIGSKMLGEGPSFEVGGKKSTGMGAMTPQDVDRLKQGNPGAASKIDDKYQQIRRGINLPLAKKEDKKEVQVSHFNMKTFGDFMSEASAAWQRKEGKNPEGGLNKAGIASYRKENPGSKLSMAVTTPPSKLKPGSKSANRRKSFCARMGGVEGPMKDDKGRPTRKALALRKWNC